MVRVQKQLKSKIKYLIKYNIIKNTLHKYYYLNIIHIVHKYISIPNTQYHGDYYFILKVNKCLAGAW